MKFTKSLSDSNCNVLIEKFPVIIYGVNIIKRSNIHLFLKKATNIDIHSIDKLENENKIQAIQLEKLIFTDLQLFLSYHNYLSNKSRKGFLSKFISFVYQPVLSLQTYFNDKNILNEFHEKMSINSKDDVI
jgi:hypothetical protein